MPIQVPSSITILNIQNQYKAAYDELIKKITTQKFDYRNLIILDRS